MDFGLGLVLSFTDNATAGINNAVNSLNRLTQTAENATSSLDQMASLSALSVVSGQIGNSFTSMGSAIISTFSDVISSVNDVGMTMMYAENQLSKLYGGVDAGAEKLSQIQDYAKQSIFNFEDLIPVVTNLKSVGIEAFDNIASSTGNANQTLMDYASDLAAFMPNMRNAYGTGIQAAMGALKEYIAEGNAMSLKRGAGLDITGILGEDKGATIEERSRQIADLIEQLGMVGMTSDLAGTPTQMLSNMEDVLFQFKDMISSSGVFDEYTNLISKIAEYVFAIPEEEMQNIANVIGSALTKIMQPLSWVVDKVLAFADSVRKLVAENPRLVKFATVGVALAGVLLVLTGVVLKATSAMSGLSLMLIASGKSFKSIGGIIKSGVGKIIGTLLPLVAIAGVLAFAWKTDFAGIKTNLTYFVSNTITAFKTANQAVNGNVNDMVKKLDELRAKDDFFSNLTIGFMKVIEVFKALVDGWSDYELSEDNFLKAKELGILPLIEAILDLKYRFGFFKQGFIDGWKEIGESVRLAVMGFLDNIEGTALESLVDNLTDFLQRLASGDTQAWYDFGKSFADFTAKAIAFWAVFKVVGKIVSVLSTVVTAIMSIGKVVSSVIGFIKGLKIISFLGKVIEVIKLVAGGAGTLSEAMGAVFGTVGTVVSGVVALVGGAFTAIFAFVKQLVDGFSWLWEIIKWIGLAIAAVGAVILGICSGPVAAIVAAIIGAITLIIELIVTFWDEICDFFSGIASWIYDNVIEPIADFFVWLWDSVVGGVMGVVDAIVSFFSGIATWLYTNVIQPIVNFFVNILFPIISKIVEIVMKIVEIIMAVVGALVGFIYNNIIQPIINFFVGLFNTIVGAVTSFISTVMSVIGSIVSWISDNIISPIANFFGGLWNGIVDGVTGAIDGIKSVFTSIVDWISENVITPIGDFFSGLWEGVQSAFQAVADTVSGVFTGMINGVLDFVVGIINGIIGGINGAIDLVNKIPGVNISKIEKLEVPKLAEGGIVDKPTMSIIGEAGTEAVMPLENNTGWIGVLANMLAGEMSDIVPTNSNKNIAQQNQGSNNSYLTTSNNNSTQTIQGDTDNSVVFNEGAIQVTVQNASEEEAIRLAKKVMEYIKRQQELDRMTQYA